MSYPTKTFVLTDPRTFDGTPFEAAEQAVRQAEAIAGHLRTAVEGARLMARNAEMERDLLLTGECDAPGFDTSAQGRKFDGVEDNVKNVQAALALLAAVAAYDPRRRV